MRLLVGDCLDLLQTLDDASVDSLVTDPPYGLSAPPDIEVVLRHWLPEDPRVVAALSDLWPHRRLPGVQSAIRRLIGVVRDSRRKYEHGRVGFMGNEWDSFVPGPRVWRQCWRVMKPGAHGIVFAGTRTVDLMAISLRLAGFEVRDLGIWCQWQGFTKSLDLSKDMDRMRHDQEQILEVTRWVRAARDAAGLRNADIDRAFGTNGMAGHWTSQASQPAVPTLEQWETLLEVLGRPEVPDAIQRLAVEMNSAKGKPGPAWEQREKVGEGHRIDRADGAVPIARQSDGAYDITAPASENARRWKGWGTHLKPAVEPWLLVRKPLEATSIARQVLATGTGGLNIDACRIPMGDPMWPGPQDDEPSTHSQSAEAANREVTTGTRWTGHEGYQTDGQQLGRFPANLVYCPKVSPAEREWGCDGLPWWTRADGTEVVGTRNGHPTLKPLRLVRWQTRLVTPPGGMVLDPFAGSGTTGMAAVGQGFDVILMELIAQHAQIARARTEAAAMRAIECDLPDVRTPPEQVRLF